MNPSICPICKNGTRSPATGNGSNGTINVNCQQCGKYVISDEAAEDAGCIPENNRAIASAWLVHNRPAVFDRTHLGLVRLEVPRPSLIVRATLMLRCHSVRSGSNRRCTVGALHAPRPSRCHDRLGRFLDSSQLHRNRCLDRRMTLIIGNLKILKFVVED